MLAWVLIAEHTHTPDEGVVLDASALQPRGRGGRGGPAAGRARSSLTHPLSSSTAAVTVPAAVRELSEYHHDDFASFFLRLLLARPGLAGREATLEAISDQLGWHPLAVEDTRERNQRPKLDHYDDHVLLVFYGVRPTSEPLDAEPVEVHI